MSFPAEELSPNTLSISMKDNLALTARLGNLNHRRC